MHKYKILALDLDDTVLTCEKKITPKNKKWIKRAHEAGVIVIISTGRGYHNIKHIREELGLNTPMVLVNGAEAWDESGNIIKRNYISKKDLLLLYELTNRFDADFWAYGDDVFVRKLGWIQDMLEQRWTQFVIRHENANVLRDISYSIEQVANNLEITSSSAINVEFTKKGVTKASGLQIICEHLGFTMQDVMAIGDNYNDMHLIKQAGLGVSMGNGVKALKDISDDITGTNEEDGVANAIKKHLF